MTHALSLTTKLDRAHIPPSGGEVHLLVQIAAPNQRPEPGHDAAGGRLPLNLAAVVDRSGSMHGPKLGYTKQALLFLVEQISETDRLAVITFDDRVETVLPSQPVTQKDPLKARLSRIESGGSTNLSGGLATGMQQITPHARPENVSRVLLMTDGQANVGVTDADTLIGWTRAWRQRGLAVSTLGVGDDFNEDLLVAMAEAGGGNFHYIANPDGIPAIFAAELQGLLQVAAQGMHLRVEAEPGVAIAGVIGYEPSGTPHAVDLTLPDLYAGEVKPLLLKLAVAAPPATGQLLRLTLDYLPATTGAAPEQLTADIAVNVTTDPAALSAPPDADVVREVQLAEAAVARDEAIRYADAGDMASGAVRLQKAAQSLEFLARSGDAEAAEQMQALQSQAGALAENQYEPSMRKQMRYESHQTRQGRRPR